MGLLEGQTAAVSGEFSSQDISQTLWAFGRLGCIPGMEMMGQLNRLSQDATTILTDQPVACCMWATAICEMTLPTDFLTRAATVSSWGDESILAISDAATAYGNVHDVG